MEGKVVAVRPRNRDGRIEKQDGSIIRFRFPDGEEFHNGDTVEFEEVAGEEFAQNVQVTVRAERPRRDRRDREDRGEGREGREGRGGEDRGGRERDRDRDKQKGKVTLKFSVDGTRAKPILRVQLSRGESFLENERVEFALGTGDHPLRRWVGKSGGAEGERFAITTGQHGRGVLEGKLDFSDSSEFPPDVYSHITAVYKGVEVSRPLPAEATGKTVVPAKKRIKLLHEVGEGNKLVYRDFKGPVNLLTVDGSGKPEAAQDILIAADDRITINLAGKRRRAFKNVKRQKLTSGDDGYLFSDVSFFGRNVNLQIIHKATGQTTKLTLASR